MKYKYVGDGTGVPGLPHEISDDEAEIWGVTELLKAAVENGSYVEVASQTLPPVEEPEIVSDFTLDPIPDPSTQALSPGEEPEIISDPHPSPLPKRERKKTEE